MIKPTIVKPVDYCYTVTWFNNYDGDSVNIIAQRVFDVGFYKRITSEQPISVRLYGIDTPELRGGTPESKAAGYLARDKVREFLQDAMDNSFLIFYSHEFKTGKFGRALGDFGCWDSEVLLSDYLLENHLAVKYFGQSKDEIKDAHARNLEYLLDNNLLEIK